MPPKQLPSPMNPIEIFVFLDSWMTMNYGQSIHETEKGRVVN